MIESKHFTSSISHQKSHIPLLFSTDVIRVALHTTIPRSVGRVALGTIFLGQRLKTVLVFDGRIACVSRHHVG